VSALIESGWTPPQFYVDSYSKLKAEPIEHEEWAEEADKERISGFTKRDIVTASTEDLKKWLILNEVNEPMSGERGDYEQIVRNNLGFCTPKKTRFGVGLRHKRPSCGRKTVCKTPHRLSANLFSEDSGDSVDEDVDDSGMEMDDEEQNGHCFGFGEMMMDQDSDLEMHDEDQVDISGARLIFDV